MYVGYLVKDLLHNIGYLVNYLTKYKKLITFSICLNIPRIDYPINRLTLVGLLRFLTLGLLPSQLK
jgi:hypothetical protein